MIGIVGLVARDVVDGGPPRVGGAAWYCTRALAVLGRPAVVATKYAPGDRRLAAPLHGLGVPVAWRPSSRTIGFWIDNGADGRAMAIDPLGEPFSPEEARGWVAEALGEATWVHAGALCRADFTAETLAELARDRRLSLEGQGLVRASRTGPVEPDDDFDPDVLRHVQVLKLGEEEAAALDLDALAVPELLVTLAARGAIVRAGGREEHVTARPLDVPDPTGAGDSFVAAYLASRESGQDPFEAAHSATTLVHGLLTRWRGR